MQAQFGAGGVTAVSTRWYGPDNGLLYELPRNYTLTGTYFSTFTLKKDSPWLEGSYRVDVYTNASPTPSLYRTIRGGPLERVPDEGVLPDQQTLIGPSTNRGMCYTISPI